MAQPTGASEAWAAAAAALPQGARRERELPFWRGLVERLGWRRVVDAGCGAGFHLSLLASLGVEVVGYDCSLTALLAGQRGVTAVGDILAPPVRVAGADAVLCLGNTISLLPSRAAQRRAVGALAAVLRPGGQLVVQGEDAGLVAGVPLARTRPLEGGRTHLRVFERRGQRVQMLAGVVPSAGEASLTTTWLLPTSATAVARMAKAWGLSRSEVPVAVPEGSGWWLLLTRR
ncbi:MAG: class I SAM-dependent methyltransferase [Thermoanaerobaculaceae bacterium]|nr:class I SAM-dependent methyltransferase [Thermoanaerobaculaceae bacterium]